MHHVDNVETARNTPGRSGLSGAEDIGAKLFELRDYTPIPLILLLLFMAEPKVTSATIGVLVIVFGELFRIYAVAFIGSVSRTRNTSTTGGNLITSGPFGWMRNPLYVGNFLITIGVAIFAGVIWLIVVTAVLFGAQYYYIVKYEEHLLMQKFGEEYNAYRQKVPAWVPSSLPALDSVEWPDTFTPALKSEKRTLTAIVLMLLALCIVA
jgi:protein-S-isoprenylcysteine O-methyltransferase Ste14